MGGDNAEKYQGFEAGFRLHVSATYAAVKVQQCPDMLTAISAWVDEAGCSSPAGAAVERRDQLLLKLRSRNCCAGQQQQQLSQCCAAYVCELWAAQAAVQYYTCASCANVLRQDTRP